MDIEDKIDALQAEVEKLDVKLSYTGRYTMYIFIVGLVIPFIIAGILYLIKPSFIMDEGTVDRKKLILWTIPITIVAWIILFFVNWYLKRKYS